MFFYTLLVQLAVRGFGNVTELDGSLSLPSVLPGSVADKMFGSENLDYF